MRSNPEHVRQALERWDGFPVDRDPRPVVLTGLSVTELDRLRADTRWRALFDGPAVPESELPPQFLQAAIDYCRDVQTRAQRPLARIIRAPGPFGTDRGLHEFPAWMMYPADRRWPFVALDPDFERRNTWRPEGLRAYSASEPYSTIAADDRTLTYRFTGTPAAYAAYLSAEVYETKTAVLVEPVETPLDPPDSFRLAYAEDRQVVVRLAAPLGNRVLIWPAHGPGSDTFASPRTVISADLQERADL